MSSSTVQIARNMGLYDPSQQFSMWRDVCKGNNASIIKPDTSSLHSREFESIVPDQQAGQSDDGYESSRLAEKIKRRMAQNREAARKSRQRKKAYVQQLESSRLKLAQLEQELERTKQQNLYCQSSMLGNLQHIGNTNAGIAAFEMKHSHWIQEHYRRTLELRTALEANLSDAELSILVEGSMNHFYSLFRMKAEAAKSDPFYLISGKWRTSVERFFFWIGGFRPSEVINVVMGHLEPLIEQQEADIKKLQHSSQQAEYALSQGLDRLQQTLGQLMLAGDMSEPLISAAIDKLNAIEGFVNQADYLREQALQLMSRILAPHQAARGLVALGDYFHRLSALSTLWTSRPHQSG